MSKAFRPESYQNRRGTLRAFRQFYTGAPWKKLATETFKTPVILALYDLTSVYFEGSGPAPLARYGHSSDHRSDRPQIILAVATDTHGTPLHISILRGNRADSTTLRSTIKILRRRFQIQDAVFVF